MLLFFWKNNKQQMDPIIKLEIGYIVHSIWYQWYNFIQFRYWDVNLIGAPIRDRDPEKTEKNTQKFTQFTQVSGIDKYIKNHQFFIILPLD